MAHTHAVDIPDIAPLADAVLGKPYAEVDCFALMRHLFSQGFGIDIDADPTQAATLIAEVWYEADATDPLTLVAPWDVLIFRATHKWTSHVGVVMDPTRFIHTRHKCGVVIEPIARWRRWIAQVARLQELI